MTEEKSKTILTLEECIGLARRVDNWIEETRCISSAVEYLGSIHDFSVLIQKFESNDSGDVNSGDYYSLQIMYGYTQLSPYSRQQLQEELKRVYDVAQNSHLINSRAKENPLQLQQLVSKAREVLQGGEK